MDHYFGVGDNLDGWFFIGANADGEIKIKKLMSF